VSALKGKENSLLLFPLFLSAIAFAAAASAIRSSRIRASSVKCLSHSDAFVAHAPS